MTKLPYIQMGMRLNHFLNLFFQCNKGRRKIEIMFVKKKKKIVTGFFLFSR